MAFGGYPALPIVQQRRQQPLQLRLLSGIQNPQQILSAGAAVMEHMTALHQKPQRAFRHRMSMPLAAILRFQGEIFAAFSAFQIVDGALIFALIAMFFFHHLILPYIC